MNAKTNTITIDDVEIPVRMSKDGIREVSISHVKILFPFEIVKKIVDFNDSFTLELQELDSAEGYYPFNVITNICLAVLDASAKGNVHKSRSMTGSYIAMLDDKSSFHKDRQDVVEQCSRILISLATLGATAIVDEVTTYQEHRAPDALQTQLTKQEVNT